MHFFNPPKIDVVASSQRLPASAALHAYAAQQKIDGTTDLPQEVGIEPTALSAQALNHREYLVGGCVDDDLPQIANQALAAHRSV